MKIAVCVCAILLVSGAQASFWGDTVGSIQQKVEAAIDVAITEVQNTVQAAKDKANDVGENLKAKAEQLAQKMYDQIREQLSSIDARIVEITNKAGNVNVDECIEIGETLEQTALAAISNMSTCVVDKIELGSGYVESIIKISDDIIANLTNIRDEARHCSDEVDGITSAAKAIVCANIAGAKATWATAKGVPAVTANVAKLTYLLGTLHITLPYCTARRGFTTLVHESDRVIAEVRHCVDRKIAEYEAEQKLSTERPQTTTVVPEQPKETTTSRQQPEQPQQPKQSQEHQNL